MSRQEGARLLLRPRVNMYGGNGNGEEKEEQKDKEAEEFRASTVVVAFGRRDNLRWG